MKIYRHIGRKDSHSLEAIKDSRLFVGNERIYENLTKRDIVVLTIDLSGGKTESAGVIKVELTLSDACKLADSLNSAAGRVYVIPEFST